MRRHLIAAVAALLAAVLAGTGCGRGDDRDLPDAAALLSASADEMARVETVGFRLESDADLGSLPVRTVDGVVTRAGDARGAATVDQFGQTVEIRFVVLDDRFHYQLLGDWQEAPLTAVAQLYDPSAILDPDRGIANLLRTATDPQVRGRESVSGVDTYEVTASFDAAALAVLLPGAPDGVPGSLWIGVERPLVHQARFAVPAGEGEAGTLTVGLSDFDAPVTIEAP
jgi:lipoprotein LprG